MISYPPTRKIIQSELKSSEAGIISSIIKPQFCVSFYIQRIPQNHTFAGDFLFAIRTECDITTPDSKYLFKIVSTIHIIDNKKPLSAWALKMLYDEEIKEVNKEFKLEIDKSNVNLSGDVEIKFNDKNIETEIEYELNRFSQE
jgi:hypothetical protein